MFSFFVLAPSQGQVLRHVQGEILIKVASSNKVLPNHILNQISNSSRKSIQCSPVSDKLGIWKLRFDANEINELQLLAHLKGQNDILDVQKNHWITYRETLPNDPQFALQWPFLNNGSNGATEDIDFDAELAWDITTGGNTSLGDEIVVAIFDNGIDIDHEDLQNNLWINSKEIPLNGIDDDENGYVDDYHGWNITTESDDINGGNHGTSSAGIIGAEGNNGIGISGINWNVKLMIIKQPVNVNEAMVLESYAYAYNMRKLYNQSNGEKGAYIVATNNSFGIDFGKPDEAPLWCSFFDSLGTEGIISCAATTNMPNDVDQLGDLPTTCESDYLLTVTNINQNGFLHEEAGFGKKSIDIGAFGDGIYTTKLDDNYGYSTGTSIATPQVAGAIALLYSGNCDNLARLSKADPAAAALLAKQIILDSSVENFDLNDITKSGGLLNINEALLNSDDRCSTCLEPSSLKAINIQENSVQISWIAGIHGFQTNLSWKPEYEDDWIELENVQTPILLNDLISCAFYDVKIQSVCDDNSSNFTNHLRFETDGCCTMPDDVNIEVLSETQSYMNWTPVTAADNYTVRIRMEGTHSGWETFTVVDNSINFNTLNECTAYEIEFKSICSAAVNSEFGNRQKFITLGCGSCTDIDYCSARSNNSQGEWINRIKLNELENASGSDYGYGDYTGMSTDLVKGENYRLQIEPGYAGNEYPQYFKAWIDYNQNGVFENESELIFDSGGEINQSIDALIQVPNIALEGITRLRIVMKFINNSIEPSPCENGFGFGEVEDYCVNILQDPAFCDRPNAIDTMDVVEEAAAIVWNDFTDDHSDHNLRFRLAGNHNWQIYENVNSPFLIENLEECTEYEVQIEANCAVEGSSGFTQTLSFNTRCQSNIFNPNQDSIFVKISPNPFTDFLEVEVALQEPSEIHFYLFDQTGRLVKIMNPERYSRGLTTYNFNNINDLSSGIYLLKMQTNKIQSVHKIIKL